MAATLCRLGGKDAAVSMCLKHFQALLSTSTQHQHQWLQKQYQQKHQQQYVLQRPQQRCLATRQSPSSAGLVPTRIHTTNIDGFELSSPGPPGNPHPRPVVVLIGWLNAKRKHLKKYQEVYWAQGFDVLTMPVSPIHIVRPKAGIKYTNRLLHALQDNKIVNQRQVVFHGFSIGAFIYTQLQKQLQQQQEVGRALQGPSRGIQQLLQLGSSARSGGAVEGGGDDEGSVMLNERIAGLVLDSPAYVDHMCRGIANSVTSNSLGRALINNTLLLYLAAFPKSVTFHYHESHRMFHDNAVPTLILYSPVDLISSAETSERYAEEWRQKGYSVFTHKFPDSSHVSHFRNYQPQYLSALHAFLGQLHLSQHLSSSAAGASGARLVEMEKVVGDRAAAVVEEAAAAGTVVQPLERVQAKAP